MRGDAVLFLEEQRFLSGRVAVALVLAIVIASCVLLANGQFAALIGMGVGLAVVLIFAVTRLKVRVSPAGVEVEFRPLVHRRIPLADISTCEARVYRPIREYGGWGVRWGWKGGRAYNVSGNRGVQLSLRSGESILLGSQRAEELASAIRQGLQSP